MTTYRIKRDTCEIKQDWPGFTYTGELLEVKHMSGEKITYRVITGSFTPAGACRDCGDHYIIAGYSSYRSVSKSDLSVQLEVDDS